MTLSTIHENRSVVNQMDDEILLITSNKDTGGIGFFDLSTGSPFSNVLKNCMCSPEGVTTVGGMSSFSGMGAKCGDYIIAAQSKKPQINVWQWGKPQALMQCHIQEITTAVAVDSNGFYLLGGTKAGRIFCWELSTGNMVLSWQAHFKAVSCLRFTPCGNFCVSTSEDGMARCWDIVNILSGSTGAKLMAERSANKNAPHFRSWSPHSLPITGLELQSSGGPCASTRVMTVSLDRSLVVYDLFPQREVLRVSHPEPLTCCVSNPTYDYAFSGSNSGKIYISSLSLAALSLASAHAKAQHDGSISDPEIDVLVGHDKAVTSIAHSQDNVTLASASMDGDVRVWNVITRQCVRILAPFSKIALTNIMVLPKPDVIDSGAGSTGTHRPHLCPIGHLKKYHQAVELGGGSKQQQPSSSLLPGRRIIGSSRVALGKDSENLSSSNRINESYMEVAPLASAQLVGKSALDDDVIKLPSAIDSYPQAPPPDSETGTFMRPPMIKRQDTFGDEFYDNWDKSVAVTGESRDDGDADFSVSADPDNELAYWKQKASDLNDQLNQKLETESKPKKAKGKKRERYHEVLQTKKEDPTPAVKKSSGEPEVIKSAAAPPKAKRNKKT